MPADPVRRARRAASALLLALFAIAGLAATARAAPAHAATSAAATAGTLTPAEASTVLAILHDPARRAAFTDDLEAFVAAARHAPTHGAGARAARAAGLPPQSLGAELITSASAFGANLGAEGQDIVRVVRSRRELATWIATVADDPAERALVIGSVWRLSVVLAVALGAVVALERALRTPIAALGRLAAGRPPPLNENGEEGDDPPGIGREDPAAEPAADAAADTGGPDAAATRDAERERRRRRVLGLARLLHALRRVPFALAHGVLQLVPTIAFVTIALGFETTGLLGSPDTDLVIGAAVHSFVVGGVLIALVGTLFAPDTPSLRLVLLRDGPARRVASWTRAGIVVGAFGFAGIVTAEGLGLPSYAAATLFKVVALVEHALLAGLIFRSRRDVARRLQPPRRVRGPARRLLAAAARRWWLWAIFFDFAFWVIWAAEVRNGYARLWAFTIETIAVVAFGRLLGIATLGALERAMHVDPDGPDQLRWFEARANRYSPMLRRILTGALIGATAVALLQVWGFDALAWFERGALGSRVLGAATSVLLSLAIGVVVWEAVNTAIDRHLDHLRADGTNTARIARINTLLPILRILLFIFVATVIVLTMLSQIGVNIAPLLGGAGIVGVAIGFGSQKLVQDFITGIFLLLENTMQVGDWITAGGLSGSVEHLSIRTMRLRAGDGSVHIIPFSSVSTVTNTNRGLGNAAVSVDVDPAEDTEAVGERLKRIALDMRADDQFGPGMLSDLQFWGVNAVSSQAVTLVGQIVCTDSARWGVQREFMRRMHREFADDGIRLARPSQRVLVGPPDEGHARKLAAQAVETATLTESPAPNALGHDS